MGLVFKDEDVTSELLVNRRSLIVWLNKAKDQYKLRHYGNIIYFSKKRLYLVLYTDKASVDNLVKELQGLDFVKKVEISKNPDLIFSAEHEAEIISKLNRDAEILHDQKEDFKD